MLISARDREPDFSVQSLVEAPACVLTHRWCRYGVRIKISKSLDLFITESMEALGRRFGGFLATACFSGPRQCSRFPRAIRDSFLQIIPNDQTISTNVRFAIRSAFIVIVIFLYINPTQLSYHNRSLKMLCPSPFKNVPKYVDYWANCGCSTALIPKSHGRGGVCYGPTLLMTLDRITCLYGRLYPHESTSCWPRSFCMHQTLYMARDNVYGGVHES